MGDLEEFKMDLIIWNNFPKNDSASFLSANWTLYFLENSSLDIQEEWKYGPEFTYSKYQVLVKTFNLTDLNYEPFFQESNIFTLRMNALLCISYFLSKFLCMRLAPKVLISGGNNTCKLVTKRLNIWASLSRLVRTGYLDEIPFK